MSSGISSTKEQAGHGAPFVSFSTVFNNYFLPDVLPDLMDTSEREQAIYSIHKDDILITRTSETIDELAMSCVAIKDYPRATYSGFVKRLRPKTKDIAYSKYLAFYLRSYLFRNTVTNNAFMTLRASFNEDIFSFLKLRLPEYSQQVKIGDLLFLIEQKIQNNNKICAELESMAKTLYDYWFVQFDFPDADGRPYRTSGGAMVWNDELKRDVPEGWGVLPIPDCCDIVDCLHSEKPTYEFEDERYYLLQLDNLVDKGLIDTTNKYYVSKFKYDEWTSRIEVRGGDLLVTNAGRAGSIYRVPDGMVTGIGRNMTAIHPRNIPHVLLYYYFCSPDMKNQIRSNTDTGSFFNSLNVRGIKELLFVAPPNKGILEGFEKRCAPIRHKIEQCANESHELAALRDWLLPMLMNGQVRVV